MMQGSGDFGEEFAAYYVAHPNFYLWNYPNGSGTPTFDDIINSADAFFAGMAHEVTGDFHSGAELPVRPDRNAESQRLGFYCGDVRRHGRQRWAWRQPL